MKKSDNMSLPMKLIDSETGERYRMQNLGRSKHDCGVKKINSRISHDDFFDAAGAICRATTRMEILKRVLDLGGRDGKFRIKSVSKLAIELGAERGMLDDMMQIGFHTGLWRELEKEDKQRVYMINPFKFTVRRISSNDDRNKLQKDWEKLTKDDIKLIDTLNRNQRKFVDIYNVN